MGEKDGQESCVHKQAKRFQRLLLGIAIFIAFAAHNVPLVAICCLIMFISAVASPKYTPFFYILSLQSGFLVLRMKDPLVI
ncbi:MAG: hypothetical protein ISR96_02620 [Nitrospira sp.]|nr:hypothetical protein [Nitrospira sp.]